jgi:mitotic-spindle organizing protein 1
MSFREADRIASAQQTLDSTPASSLFIFCECIVKCNPPKALYDMSQLLGTQLDKETLATCIGMIESGVNPEALAVRV